MWQIVKLRFATRIALTTVGDHNLYVMDATSPHDRLEIIGKCNVHLGVSNATCKTRGVVSNGKYAYVVFEVGSNRREPFTMLGVVDIWEPTLPFPVGACSLSPTEASGPVQYIQDEEMVVIVFCKELSFVDVSDPLSPIEVATQKFMGRTSNLDVHIQKIR